jgi:TolB protein
MKQPHASRRALSTLLAGLSMLMLWTGPAAVPPPPTPLPTPAQQDYADWATLPRAASTGERGTFPEAMSGASPALLSDCNEQTSQDRYTAVVYSGLSYGSGWDEDIYFSRSLCQSAERLNQDTGSDFEPRLNQAVTAVAFVSARNSTAAKTITNIYTMTINGVDQRRLTFTQGQDRTPSFSPDGSRIVFASDRGGNADIYVMNSDGSGVIALTSAPEADVEPDWSPDGQHIAWVRRLSSGMGVLYVMDADGANPRALVTAPYAGQPVWSPGGSRIALRLDADGDGWYELATINADGSELNVLPLPKPHGATADLEMGGWLPEDAGLVYNEIFYQLYEGRWLIDATYLSQVSLDQPDSVTPLPAYVYLFTPHARSLDDAPPVSTLKPLPEFSPAGQVKLEWSISDDYSQPYSYTVQASSDRRPEWQNLIWAYFGYYYSPQTGSMNYAGQPGTTAYFRVQAVDRAGHVETPNPQWDAMTQLYQWKGLSTVLDARERPLEGVQLSADPVAMNEALSAADGQAPLYFPVTGRFNVTSNKAGYAAQTQNWSMGADQAIQTVLTGAQELLRNGRFENQQPLAEWQTGGDLPVAAAAGRYGGLAAQLGLACTDPLCLSEAAPVAAPVEGYGDFVMATDDQGRTHVRYDGKHYGVLDENGILHPWPDLPGYAAFGAISFAPSGAPFIKGFSDFYFWNGSAWDSVPLPSSFMTSASYTMDSQERMHVVYYDNLQNKTFYIRLNADLTWTAPLFITNSGGNQKSSVALDSEGNVHIVVATQQLTYARVSLSNGTLVETQVLGPSNLVEYVFIEFIPGRGLVLTAAEQQQWRTMQRGLTGSWSNLDVDGGLGWAQRMRRDKDGNIYVLVENREALSNSLIDMRYAMLTAGENRFQTYILPNEIASNTDFDLDLQGRPVFFYNHTGPEWDAQILFRRGVTLAQAGSATLAQEINLSANLSTPTLSFFYRLDAPNPDPASLFRITLTPAGGESVVLFSRPAANSDWTHAWVDLTPYLGQTGSLSFELEQSAGEYPARLTIAETSVASWPTPFLTTLTPRALAYPLLGENWVDLYGENLQPGALVFVGETQADTVEWIDSAHVRLLVPQVPMGIYPLRLVNPGGGESRPLTLQMGNFAFMPVTLR